ncbi:MAG: hypothetical protein WBC44_15420 [Planctomycetaceae bacterium]
MTRVRRFPSCRIALIALGGLLTGCAGSGQFSAGRLPYGGDSQIAAQDPFAGVSDGKQVAGADGRPSASSRPSGQPINRELTSWNQDRTVVRDDSAAGEDYAAPPATDSQWRHESAAPTTRQAAYFEPATENPFAGAPSNGTSSPPNGGFRQMSYAAPAATSPNPFADVEGQPATQSASTPPSSEEQFLPPIR